MLLAEILAMADEDAQFEALTDLHAQWINGEAEPLSKDDVQALAAYLEQPTFPENEAMAWTVAIALPDNGALCGLATSRLFDTTRNFRELIVQYLRIHCIDQFLAYYQQLKKDDDCDVRFEALDYASDQDPAAALQEMIPIAGGLSHGNFELLRQYLVKYGTVKHLQQLQGLAGGMDDPNVFDDLLQTVAEVRPDLLKMRRDSR